MSCNNTCTCSRLLHFLVAFCRPHDFASRHVLRSNCSSTYVECAMVFLYLSWPFPNDLTPLLFIHMGKNVITIGLRLLRSFSVYIYMDNGLSYVNKEFIMIFFEIIYNASLTCLQTFLCNFKITHIIFAFINASF